MTPDDIRNLLTTHLTEVLALDEPPPPDANLEADLHADSLDLVEVVEAVERELEAAGHPVTMPEERLLSLETVADVVAAIHDHIDRPSP